MSVPVQVIADEVVPSLEISDLTGLSAAAQAEKIDQFSRERIDASVNELKEERAAVEQLALV